VSADLELLAYVQAANDPEGGFATVVVRPRFVWGRGDTVVLKDDHGRS